MRILLTALRRHAAALRVLIAITVVFGVLYPAVITLTAQLPGLRHRADGSLVERAGKVVGSSLLGQSFLDDKGHPLPQYFQPRPSAAGDGYDPTATGAGNLGPESIVDTLPDPAVKDDTGTRSLLTQVCARSLAVGKLEHVDGSRPFCTPSGVGAVLAVFYRGAGYTGPVVRAVSVNEACPATPLVTTYKGVKVECAKFGDDHSAGKMVPLRGDAPASPAVPADAVTASASGLDPTISLAYAKLQIARVAQARGITTAKVAALVKAHTAGRALGFMGEPAVNVLNLNLDLDRRYPLN